MKNSAYFLKFLTIVVLGSCNSSAPVMVNFSAKDMNQTGERYYEDWVQSEADTVSTLEGYDHKEIPTDRYGDRTDIIVEKTGFYHAKKIKGKW